MRKAQANLFPKLDLIIGGSPCQGFSFAGKQLNFNDPRSILFFEFVRFLKEAQKINPYVKFLLENVKMKQEYQDVISKHLGVQPILINSALVSAQTRKRLYWTNIPYFGEPKHSGIMLKDILEYNYFEQIGCILNHGKYYERNEKAMCLDANYHKGADNHGQRTIIKQINPSKKAGGKQPHMQDRVYHIDHKSIAVTAGYAERLQTVPDNYTSAVSNSQRYKMLGNGWNVDTIVHLFKPLAIIDLL